MAMAVESEAAYFDVRLQIDDFCDLLRGDNIWFVTDTGSSSIT